MANFIITNKIETPKELDAFTLDGYRYSPENSKIMSQFFFAQKNPELPHNFIFSYP